MVNQTTFGKQLSNYVRTWTHVYGDVRDRLDVMGQVDPSRVARLSGPVKY
jgi:hypothetical protein